jgi:hypothetical protein
MFDAWDEAKFVIRKYSTTNKEVFEPIHRLILYGVDSFLISLVLILFFQNFDSTQYFHHGAPSF